MISGEKNVETTNQQKSELYIFWRKWMEFEDVIIQIKSLGIAFFSEYVTIQISADLLSQHLFQTNHMWKSEPEAPI